MASGMDRSGSNVPGDHGEIASLTMSNLGGKYHLFVFCFLREADIRRLCLLSATTMR
jgi:hypothetical protein